ncbi:MAG TPA: hypothetical protein PKV72_04605, partial [Candidatus Peribacteria bacterium]|nr:hypothetical protein [Candidatus Peribacteria bacterium]
VTLSVPGQPNSVQSMAGTGTVTVTSGVITLVRTGATLTVRQNPPAPVPGTAIVSILRQREPSPRSVPIRYGPVAVEAPAKADAVTIDATGRYVIPGDFPNETLTIGGVSVLVGANRTPAGRFIISRSPNGATVTVATADPALPMVDVPLTITGGGINRTIRFTYTPEVAPAAFRIPSLAFNATTAPRQTITNAPAVVLRANGTTGVDIPLDTGTTPVVIGRLRISRSNGGRTMVVEPDNLTTAINQTLALTGPGGIATSPVYTFTPEAAPAPVIPVLAPISLTPGTPRTTLTGMPARALTANGTALPVDATNVEVGNLKISRTNGGATMTVEVISTATAISGYTLTIGGAGLTDRSTTVNFVPESIPAIAPITLTPGTPRITLTGMPARALTANGTALPVDATNVTVGNLKISRTNGGASMTIEVAVSATPINNFDLVIGGSSLTSRTTRVNYVPPAPGEIPLAAAITLAGTPPRSVTNGIPAQALTMTSPGPVSTPLAVDANVTVGNLRIRRSAAGATMTIEVVDADVAVTNYDLTMSGTSLTSRTTRINYAPPPPEAIPLAAAITLTGTPPRNVTTGIPARALTLTTNPGPATTALPLDADVTVGNLRIRRSTGGTTMTIDVVNAATAVTNYDLAFSGTRVVSRTSRVNYVPPAPVEIPLPATVTIAGTPPRTRITGMPTRELTSASTSPSTVLPVNAAAVTVGNLKITREDGGATMIIEPVDATQSISGYSFRLSGSGLTERTATVNFTPSFTVPDNIELTGTPPSTVISGLPAGPIRLDNTIFPADETERTIGSVKIKRAAGGRSMTIKAADAATVVNQPLRIRFGSIDVTTALSYTPPLPALAAAVTISNTTLSHSINNIPAGELRVRGRVLAVNGTVGVNAAGEIVANDAPNIAMLFTRVSTSELQCAALSTTRFATAVAIQRNGDASATDVTFTFNP